MQQRLIKLKNSNKNTNNSFITKSSKVLENYLFGANKTTLLNSKKDLTTEFYNLNIKDEGLYYLANLIFDGLNYLGEKITGTPMMIFSKFTKDNNISTIHNSLNNIEPW